MPIMPKFKIWLRRKTKRLRERAAWAIFTGLAQAVVRYIAEYLGWPAAITLLVVTGSAAVIDFFAGIPSAWVWFAAALALTLGMPPTIRASADFRRASAELINAASKKQKLDQAEQGLRGPKAGGGRQNQEHAENLESLYTEGENLLERDRALQPAEWRQKIVDWFDKSEEAVKAAKPDESFMYRTISRRPKSNEKFDECPKLLAARLIKLRKIIGRFHTG